MTGPLQSTLLGLQGLGGTEPAAVAGAGRSAESLAQDDFLRLMTAQLQAQDPFAPMESGEFLSQFAEFGTVSGIQGLQESFTELSSSLKSLQALQASSLVGRSVLIDASAGLLPAGGELAGSVQAQGASSVLLNYHDASGQLVHQQSLPVNGQGRVAFAWDGTTAGGTQLPPGIYGISAQAIVGGESVALSTQIRAGVESVTLGRDGGGLTLNLAGLGSVAAGQVVEIM